MQAEPYSGNTSASGDRSPLSGFDFLKNISKKQTKDGQPPKRRGPKPDSKPALTRRQELNRQAQRTHRERKEMYIKALEQEVLRLKEIFSNTSKERDAVVEENRKLREVLAAHGIKYDVEPTPLMFSRSQSAGGYGPGGPSSSGSISGSYGPGTESSGVSPPAQSSSAMTMGGQSGPVQRTNTQSMAQLPNNNLDYDQIGIDFVLTYDAHGRPVFPSDEGMQWNEQRAPYPSPPPQH